MSRELYIVQHEGVGQHDYRAVRYWGPFTDMMAVLCYLYDGSRSPFVGHTGFLQWFDDNITHLVCGPEDGSMAWLTDTLGVSIENAVPEGDVMRMWLKPVISMRLSKMLNQRELMPIDPVTPDEVSREMSQGRPE